jgi:hypothetical protein
MAHDVVVDSLVIAESGIHSPIATDFDRDGNDEIILLAGNGHLLGYSFTDLGIESPPFFNFHTGDTALAGPAVADLSGNGFPELVVPGVNRIHGFDRTGYTATNFPIDLDFGRSGQLITTTPVISDVNGDQLPDIAVITLDSIFYDRSYDSILIIFPDPENYPDSFYIEVKTVDYTYYNYYSNLYVVSPDLNRLQGFPLPTGAFTVRQLGDTIVGMGTPLHLKVEDQGMLVTTGADGWIYGWNSGWSDDAAFWPMAGRSADGGGYLELSELGQETAQTEFMPEAQFFCYPNPATQSSTNIRYYVNQPATVTITIFDALGDRIEEITRDMPDGNRDDEYEWDLTDVASGVYHCRIEAVATTGSESKVAFKSIAVIK